MSVAVQPTEALGRRMRLFDALEAAFPVRFVADRADDVAGTIVFCRGDAFSPAAATAAAPILEVGAGPGRAGPQEEVLVSSNTRVDRRLRGVALSDPLDGPSLRAPGDERATLASTASGPVWTHTGEPPESRQTVRSTLPELEPEQSLRDLLFERPLTMVALIGFLRQISAPLRYEPPPLRAAILFDDPNLRRGRYGFIEYERLLAHADAHGYHASMAMIPLDGRRRQDRGTVELFRSRPDRLSLTLHGNDHLAGELIRADRDEAALAVAAQALRRAGDFEAANSLRIDRVMTPPHGLCSESVARAVGALAFDALCAIHPLPWRERPPADNPLAGWDPATFAAGCAVLPRMPLGTPPDQIALRAFLDQPLVLYGHHGDLRDGLAPLAQAAATVNGLGDVRWCSLTEIAQLNHASRLEDDGVLRVRPFAQQLRLSVPAGAESLLVERPASGTGEIAGFSIGDSAAALDSPLPCAPGEHLLTLRHTVQMDPTTIPSPRRRLWPVVRRALTESRDRLQPLLAPRMT